MIGLNDMSASRRVAIIILNWNNWQDTIGCLESLQALAYPDYAIFVVDNGSSNDSVYRINKWCENRSQSSKIFVIKTEENLGYAGGNNFAIRHAFKEGFDYYWILNNDTVVHKDALSEMVNLAMYCEQIGMICSKIYNYKQRNKIESVGSNKVIWPFFLTRNKTNCNKQGIEVKWVRGASFLVKREVIEQVGMFDEKYFLYVEEKDWSIRAAKQGWKLHCALRSKVWHKEGASNQSNKITKEFFRKQILRLPFDKFLIIGYYQSRNGIYFMKKNYPLLFLPYLFLRTFHLIIQVLLYDDEKLCRIKVILKGAWHGVIEKMGKADCISSRLYKKTIV